MGVNRFTAEQIEKLKKNPYVESVTDKYINYSKAFKELFWNDYQNGMAPLVIFKNYGFDPGILGAKRRNGFVYRIKQEAKRLEDLKILAKETVDDQSQKI
ncbi:HTH domain-containing protein [uncultured Traorella sp.]|uniref:HTH domain-containing protein n=1 Tax=uncultured Traorella sp. TaxID=1929048 RepID=UPI0025D27E9D|nr:HTH domain-containing protein [uncultured Traorella sp.]